MQAWARCALVLVWIALAACLPQQGSPPVLFGPMAPANGNATSVPPLVVLDDQPDQAMLARALCDLTGECPAEAEDGPEGEEGAEGEEAAEGEEGADGAAESDVESTRQVTQELADLDADGRNEVLVRVMHEDYVVWHVLARRDDAYVSLYELTDDGTQLRAAQSASGRPLLIREHDCCCMYELEVLALQGDTFEPLFSWGSSCQAGCDEGYQAYLMVDDAQRLTSIQLPEGRCGADGTTYIDTATWQPAAP